MSDFAESSFRWEELDQRLLTPKLQDLAIEMQKKAVDAERQAGYETRQTGNSGGYLPRLLEKQREVTDEWAKRLYEIYCEVWCIQGHEPTADFIRAVGRKAISGLIASRKDAVEWNIKHYCIINRKISGQSDAL